MAKWTYTIAPDLELPKNDYVVSFFRDGQPAHRWRVQDSDTLMSECYDACRQYERDEIENEQRYTEIHRKLQEKRRKCPPPLAVAEESNG